MKQFLSISITLLSGLIVGSLVTHFCEKRLPGSRDHVSDTTKVYIPEKFSGYEIPSVDLSYDLPELVLVPVIDTVSKEVVRYINLPREYKFSEAGGAKIWYSGVDPRIDSLEVSREVQTITVREPWKRNVFSLNAGTGYYGGLRLDIDAEYRYSLTRWMDVGVRAGYDFVLKQPYAMGGFSFKIISW